MRLFGRARAAAPWAALFVSSASPGAVIRFLERRPAPDGASGGLLLGEAAPGAQPWRALVAVEGADATQAWMEASAIAFAAAFPPAVTLIFADDAKDTWGWRAWESGPPGAAACLTEKGDGEPSRVPALIRRLAGLDRVLRPTALAVAYANARDFPAGGIPALVADHRRENVPRVTYETVAGLDARGLLREDGSRWYTWHTGI
jgi:hypothetical protein